MLTLMIIRAYYRKSLIQPTFPEKFQSHSYAANNPQKRNRRPGGVVSLKRKKTLESCRK
jgi:hypothetical protein